MTGATSQTTWNALLKNWINKYGAPERVLCDSGVQFTSTTFKTGCVDYEIKPVCTLVCKPQGNGVAERVMQT